LAALVTHRAPEPPADVGLDLGDEVVVPGSGEPGLEEPPLGEPALGEAGSGELLLGEPALGVSGPGDADEGALELGDVPGEWGAALWVSGTQPVSTTMVEDTAIAGQIRFGFTTSLLCLSVT
jgi:hypothetical protein